MYFTTVFHVIGNCAKLYSLHKRCGISPVLRCTWHNVTAHKTFQANISSVKNEIIETCISIHFMHFNKLTKVHLLAKCKARISNSMAVCRNTRLQVPPRFFLSRELGPGFKQWPDKVGTALLRVQTNSPHTFLAWLDRRRFRYLPLKRRYRIFLQSESGYTDSERLWSFPRCPAPLRAPAVIAHLEYSAAATAKQLHFLPPDSRGICHQKQFWQVLGRSCRSRSQRLSHGFITAPA